MTDAKFTKNPAIAFATAGPSGLSRLLAGAEVCRPSRAERTIRSTSPHRKDTTADSRAAMAALMRVNTDWEEWRVKHRAGVERYWASRRAALAKAASSQADDTPQVEGPKD